MELARWASFAKNRFFFGSEWTWRITLLRRNHGFWVYTLFLWKQGKRVRSFEPTFINLLKKSITAGVKTTGLGWIPNDFSILAQSFRGRQCKPENNLFFFPHLSLLVPLHGYRLFWKYWKILLFWDAHCTVSLNLNFDHCSSLLCISGDWCGCSSYAWGNREKIWSRWHPKLQVCCWTWVTGMYAVERTSHYCQNCVALQFLPQLKE